MLLAFVGDSRQADAAAGDVLGTIERNEGCFGQFGGVGVAYHMPTPPLGDNLVWYSCQNPATGQESTDLFYRNIDFFPALEPDTGIRPVMDDDGHNIPIEALAWDQEEELRWGVNRIPVAPAGPGVVSGVCAVWRLDLNQPNDAHLAFAFEDPNGGCDFFSSHPKFYDGLTVDTATDTLYLSPANGAIIRHFNKDGTTAANDMIDFEALTNGICDASSCLSSGLQMGVDGSLLSATGESGKLVRIDPDVSSVIGVYDTGTGQDWDIECGPIFTLPDGTLVNTILSADLYSNLITMMQAPNDVCDAGDYAARNPVMLPDTSFSAGPGEIVYGVMGFEHIGVGPDIEAAGGTLIFTSNYFWTRIIAAPGDRCFVQSFFGPTDPFPESVPCAEGDLPVPGFGDLYGPSIGGWACYDGADNDSDGLVDGDDEDCRGIINRIEAKVAATGQYESSYRTFAFLCYEPGDYSREVSTMFTGGLPESNLANPQRFFIDFTFHCGP